ECLIGPSGGKFWLRPRNLARRCRVFENQSFQQLVEADNITGEVVGTNGFIVEIKGLEGVRLGAQVMFADGQRGLVREAHGDRVLLFNLDSESIELGTLVVVQSDELQV